MKSKARFFSWRNSSCRKHEISCSLLDLPIKLMGVDGENLMGLFLSKVGFIIAPTKQWRNNWCFFCSLVLNYKIGVDVFVSYQPIFGFTMFWPAPGTPQIPFRESSPTFDLPKRWGTGEASWWNAEKRGQVLKLGLSTLGSKQLCWFFKRKMDLNGWSLPASLVSSRYHCKVYLAAVLVSKIIQSLMNWVVDLFFAKLFGGCQSPLPKYEQTSSKVCKK